MKAKFTLDSNGSVLLERDNFSGDRVSELYFSNGRYVFAYRNNGNHMQVCEKLHTRGSTLMCGKDGNDLLTLIRCEYRKFQRSEKGLIYKS